MDSETNRPGDGDEAELEDLDVTETDADNVKGGTKREGIVSGDGG